MYTVYKHLDNEENIIYIGKSKSLLHRQRQHSKNAEWFDEIDSIEYCALDSKIEMDIMELYLINTLNPKYNKKDKREDKFGSVNVSELKWLEFDMSEIEVNENKNKSKVSLSFEYVHEKFIERYIKKCSHYSLISDNNTFGTIEKINFENMLIVDGDDKTVHTFKDIILYKNFYDCENATIIDADDDHDDYYCLFNSDNEKLIFKNITKCKYHECNEIKLFKKRVLTEKEIYYKSLDWTIM